MNSREYEKVMTQETAKYPGLSVSFEHRGKHKAAVFAIEDKTRRVFYPASPSDSRTGTLNKLQDVRRVLREMGVL